MRPGARRLGRDETEAERAHAPLAGVTDGADVRTRDPERRMRLLQRLGNHVARGKVVVLAVKFPILAGEHRDDGAHRLLPAFALVAHADAERMQFRRPRRLAHAEIDAAAGQQIERRHLLRHALRLVGGELDHAMAEPDALGALARRAEEHLGGGGVRVLLEEVMLDHPGIVVAEFVGELELVERLLKQLVFAGRGPGARQLMLVEHAEFHRWIPSPGQIARSARRSHTASRSARPSRAARIRVP